MNPSQMRDFTGFHSDFYSFTMNPAFRRSVLTVSLCSFRVVAWSEVIMPSSRYIITLIEFPRQCATKGLKIFVNILQADEIPNGRTVNLKYSVPDG